jgi:deoxyribodipyrimidine photo-lyase
MDKTPVNIFWFRRDLRLHDNAGLHHALKGKNPVLCLFIFDRVVVASFLTKDLLIDWRRGEQYFAQKLLDYEMASNVGGWQWVAGCGTDAAPYFRIFNPDSQLKKFDPELKYIKKWVPEYAEVSKYPKPIIDHAFARERRLDAFNKTLTK